MLLFNDIWFTREHVEVLKNGYAILYFVDSLNVWHMIHQVWHMLIGKETMIIDKNDNFFLIQLICLLGHISLTNKLIAP